MNERINRNGVSENISDRVGAARVKGSVVQQPRPNPWNQFQMRSQGMFSNTKKASTAYDLLKKQNWVGLQKLGNSSWPPNRGFISTSDKLLSPDTLFDRYGGFINKSGVFKDIGSFASPTGVPFKNRSLPQGSLTKPYNQYEVIKSLPVTSGKAIPWFGQPGKGTQYELPASIDDLLQSGIIRRK